MDPQQNQSQQGGNASNNQPGERAPNAEVFSLMFRLDRLANSPRHYGHQTHQTNTAGSYAGGPPVGAANVYGQPNQQPGEGARRSRGARSFR